MRGDGLRLQARRWAGTHKCNGESLGRRSPLLPWLHRF